MAHTRFILASAALAMVMFSAVGNAQTHPDVLTIPADLENPPITTGEPAPGKMVLQSLPAYGGTEVAHALYLPRDWSPGKRFPVIIEYRGNSAPVRENKGIGYALSGGQGFIWAVLPFVSADGKQDMAWWWGDVSAIVAYAKAAVPAICQQWGGDPGRVVLTGYSRGAIACNYIGLHDDEIAKLWRAIIAASHYDDGHIAWGMTPEEQRRAPERLRRLGATPQLICGEYCSRPQLGSDAKLRELIQARNLTNFTAAKEALGLAPITEVEGTRKFIEKHHPQGRYTFMDLPWVNHGSAVFSRATPERQRLRAWLTEMLVDGAGPSANASPSTSPAPPRADGKRVQYLVLNYSASIDSKNQAQEMMTYVRDTFGAANRTSRLKVGLAILYTPKDRVAESAARLRADLALAQQMDVPVLIQVDTENWLPESLLNWYYPRKPGYDPAKVADVEWYGWTPDTAVKLCWRNWGSVVRVGPHPNLLSPRFQAWEKDIYTALAPVVVEWLKTLPAEKQWLFVGWKCGWETTPNSQYAYFKDGNSYYNRTDNPKWIEADKQFIGYNAARTAGFQTSGVLDYQHSYDVFMKIIGAHLSFLAKTARSLGLPREKLFVHTIAQGVDRYNLESQFNADSNPSPSFYGKPTTSLRDNASFLRCLAKARGDLGAVGYGLGEFHFGAKDYETWHRWFTEKLAADPDCIFAALYNYDTMKGQPEIERAMFEAMKKAPN